MRQFQRNQTASTLACLVVMCLAGCAASPTKPAPSPPPPHSDTCRALEYPGANGGERIQNSIDDALCRTISVAESGPDGSGEWFVGRPIRLRSGITLEGSDGSTAKLIAIEGAWGAGLLLIDGQSDVTIRRLSLQNSKLAPNGIRITAS